MKNMLLTILIFLLFQLGSSYFYDGSGCTDVALRFNIPCSVKSANITVFTETDMVPFVSRIGNGVPFGFDIELMNYISFIYRINFKYRFAQFQDLISQVQNERNVISISTHTITAARIQLVDFAQFFKTGTGFLVRSTYTGMINELSDLCGKTVGVQSSTIQERDVQQQNTKCPSNNRITIVSVITYPTLIEIVRNGTVDVSILDEALLVTSVLESNNQLKAIGKPYDVQPYGILCNKDNRALCCTLVNGINYLIQEGIYEKLLRKYSFTYANNGICPSRINLKGSTCEEKCTPSQSTCKSHLN